MKISFDNKPYSTDRVVKLMQQHKLLATKQGNIVLRCLKISKTTKLKDAKRIYDLCNKNFKFIVDPISFQKIVLPIPLVNIKKADCKSFAMFCYGCLSALGYNPKIKFVSYDNDPQPNHVYVMLDNIVIDATVKQFNFEFPYNHQIII